jgi:hypothetical protein
MSFNSTAPRTTWQRNRIERHTRNKQTNKQSADEAFTHARTLIVLGLASNNAVQAEKRKSLDKATRDADFHKHTHTQANARNHLP